MRNLKKILALVLALMMVLSVMVFASAANYDDYSDKDQVSPEYAEAVEVLTGMDIFWGSENSFYPKSNVTRAEVATLLYRIMTGDITGSQVGIYKDYGMFDDVLETNWFAGYVNYAANGELVVGVGDNKYNPQGNVTGYEWITMLLRAIGYDANGEISGSDWKITAAGLAKKAGILEGFNEATLNSALTREQVAYLLFNAIQASQVYYTPALNYYIDDLPSIGVENFDLASTKLTSVDEWGRPGYYWYADVDADAAKEAGEATYATIEEEPVITYDEAVTECDVADDTTDRDTTYALYVNGKTSRGNYTVNALDTVTKIGAQGRLTEVYADRIVMIDTMLAQVTAVADAAYDAAGHLRTPATITLTVYDNSANGTTNYKLTNGTTNWTYAVGNMVLLNAYTAAGTATTSTTVTKDVNTNVGTYGEILGAASSVVGAQTIIYTNASQHNVNGTVYDDAYKFWLDQAGNSTANFTWYFDQYNNLIGATEIAAATSYGVITSIWWAGNTTDGSGVANATVTYMDGTTGTVSISSMTVDTAGVGNAYVALTGTPTYSIIQQDIMRIVNNRFYVTTDANTNALFDNYTQSRYGIVEDNLFQFTTQANGTVAAREVAGNTADTDGLANVTTAVSKDTLYYNLITNNSTVFLIKNANGTYTTTTGINNIGSYVQGEVDYVDVNRDGVADYVYITAAPTDAITDNLFYYAGGQGSYNTATGVYTIPGYVDGVAGQIQTTNATFYNTIITGGTHKLYAVTITNGNVSAVSGFSTGNVSYTPGNSNVYTAYNGHLVVSVISGAAGDGYNNGVYTDAGYSNFVANANTKVYGQWATDMSDKDVIVVWNNNSGTAEHTLMLQAYIVDKSSAVPDPSPVTTGNIVRVVEIYQGGQLIGSRTATQTGVTAQTYTTGQDYASVSRVLPSLQVSGATVVEDVTSVTVVAGQTVTVTYKVAL